MSVKVRVPQPLQKLTAEKDEVKSRVKAGLKDAEDTSEKLNKERILNIKDWKRPMTI